MVRRTGHNFMWNNDTGTKIRRTKQERHHKMLLKGGPIHYGFRVGSAGVLEPIAAEIDAIRQMDRLRQDGMTYRQIADQLNQQRVAPPGHGLRWYPATVRGILRHPFYRRTEADIPADLSGFDAVRARYIVSVTSILPWR